MAKVPKKLYAFRLNDETATRIVKLADQYHCSQAEAIERALIVAERSADYWDTDAHRQSTVIPHELNPVFRRGVPNPNWRANRKPLLKPKEKK